jgi:hypothetical protein
MYQKFTGAAQGDAAAQAELALMQGQYQTVSTTVKGLGTSEGLGAAVRERYGLGLPGEHEIDIVRQATTSANGSAPGPGIWERLWHALFVW